MKAVMISIQPYWAFLIIAKAMGWEIKQHKEIEVRKNYPKAEDWNKVAKIYCSKDKKSFDRIPEKYRPAMKKFLGKVIGKFVCDRIYDITPLCDIPTFVNRYVDILFTIIGKIIIFVKVDYAVSVKFYNQLL